MAELMRELIGILTPVKILSIQLHDHFPEHIPPKVNNGPLPAAHHQHGLDRTAVKIRSDGPRGGTQHGLHVRGRGLAPPVRGHAQRQGAGGGILGENTPSRAGREGR